MTRGGTVAPTLALSLGAPAAFAPFVPGVANTYTRIDDGQRHLHRGRGHAQRRRPVTDGDRAPGQRGVLAAVGAAARRRPAPLGTGGAFADVGGSSAPTSVLTYAAPVSNDAVTVQFQQAIGANDALRTGAYSKALTFTLATTTP